MSLITYFSAGPVNRASEVRADEVRLRAAFEHADTRFIAMWRSQCMISDGAAVYLRRADLGLAAGFENAIYLGTRDDCHLFACALSDDLDNAGPDAAAFENFRDLLGGVSAGDAAVLAYAKGMLEWQRRHRHCGMCGTRNSATAGGFVMTCSNSACGNRCFPRVDPAIIVLVIDGDRCLLGHQSGWPARRYSTVAGFAEPGESLEDAVRREVQEETNVGVGEVKYLGSQPWPFPQGMMIGFHATALTTEIRLNDAELADAGWYTRADIMRGEIVLPPLASIAFELIAAWFDQHDGPRLASLGLSGNFSRSARTED